jgi:hypothetical protein
MAGKVKPGAGRQGKQGKAKGPQRAENMDGMPCARKRKNTQYDRKS